MAMNDWYEHSENHDGQTRSSTDSVYQNHEGETKEYELPPMTNGYHVDNESLDGYPTPEYDELPSPTPPPETETQHSNSFMVRLASIPIIQDGLWGAQKILQQHSLGRFALQRAESTLTKIQPFVDDKLGAHLERANALGHRSLDLVEKRFPALVHANGKELVQAIHPHAVVEEIKGRIGQAIHNFCMPSDATSEDVNRRIAQVMDNVEAALDQYFPIDSPDEHFEREDSSTEANTQRQQLMRMYHIANSLSRRIAKRMAMQVKPANGVTENDAEQATKNANSLRRWLSQQSQLLLNHLEQYKTQLPEPIQMHVIEPLAQVIQKEYFILRQELDRPGTSSVERVRNVLAASQDMVIMPLLQRSVDTMRSQVVFYRSMAQQNRQYVMTELSSRVPLFSNIASVVSGAPEDNDLPIPIQIKPSFSQDGTMDQ